MIYMGKQKIKKSKKVWIHVYVKKGFEGGLFKFIHVTPQSGWVSGDGGSCEITAL